MESIAASTRRTYEAGVRSYLRFTESHGIVDPYPASDMHLTLWFTYLAEKDSPVSARSIKTYLSGVVSFHERLGYAELMRDKPLSLRAWMGIRRHQGERERRTRLPITTGVLRDKIRPHLRHGSNLGRVVWAVCCLATCGLFRCGELVSTSSTELGLMGHQLTMFDDQDQPVPLTDRDAWNGVTRISITLLQSKTDPWRKGVNVHVGHTMAIEAWIAYLHGLPTLLSPLSPLFQSAPGVALTRSTFLSEVRTALTSAGVRASDYAGHSFRRGGATSLRVAGVPDSLIQLLGRWKSDSYRTYIEPSVRAVVEAGRRM